MYNGYKKVHSIKVQSIATENGLIAHLYGPVEGKGTTEVLNQLEHLSFNPHGDTL